MGKHIWLNNCVATGGSNRKEVFFIDVEVCQSAVDLRYQFQMQFHLSSMGVPTLDEIVEHIQQLNVESLVIDNCEQLKGGWRTIIEGYFVGWNRYRYSSQVIGPIRCLASNLILFLI